MSNRNWDEHLAAAKRFGKTSSCTNKVKYKTFGSASQAAVFASKKYNNTKSPYPCPFCNKWHVGRKLSDNELRRK